MKVKTTRTVLRLFVVFMLVTLLFSVTACSCGSNKKKNDNTEGNTDADIVFTLDKTNLELTVDEGVGRLELTIANIDDTIEWKSNKTNIATVTPDANANNKATVRPVSAGNAVISVRAGDNIAVCTVKVKPAPKLELITKSLEIFAGKTGTIEVDTDIATLSYRSDNTSVATVNGSGLVTGVSAGSANIIISGGNKSVSCPVTVIGTSVAITKPASKDAVIVLTLEEGKDTYQLEAESNGEVEWFTGNTNIAEVDGSGLLTAKAKGETTVIARYGSAEDFRTVKVKDEIITVNISETEHTLEIGESFTLTAEIVPEQTGDDALVTWSVVEGKNIVTVDEGGLVTTVGKNFGTATVRATSKKDTDAWAECVITVPDPYGDWIKISDKASLEAALTAANENKNMLLTANIDLGGATIESGLNGYRGTIDGFGYEISNFKGRLFENLSGTVQNLAISFTTNKDNEGICHHLNGDGVIKNCRIEVTFGTNLSAGIGCFVQGKVENTIILARNPDGYPNAYAATVQNNMGSSSKVFYAVYEGTVSAGGATLKTDEQLKNPDTFDGSWEEGWVIIEGEIPVLKNALVKEPLKIKLDKTEDEIFVGESTAITATVTPESLSDGEREIIWASDKEDIATVAGGVVTARKAGVAIISATSADGSVTVYCTVTVKAIELSIDDSSKVDQLKVGGRQQLTYTINRGGVIWNSSDENKATVAGGLVTAHGTGTVTITVTSVLDPSVSDSITIEIKDTVVVTVELSQSALNLDRGESATLEATVTNSNAGVVWSVVDGRDIVDIDPDTGEITALGKDGTATVRATAKDDGGSGEYAHADCTVTVEYIKEVITVEKTDLVIPVEKVVTLAEIATASKGGLSLSLKPGSASGIVTVDADKITAISEGTVTVLLTWHIDYDDIQDDIKELTVTVFRPSVQLEIDSDKRALKVGESSDARILHITMDNLPANPAASDIAWTSSDTSVIDTVTAGYKDGVYSGALNAVGEGYTVITATYTAGGAEYRITCEVAVFTADGTWKAIYDLNSFKNAFSVAGNYYLAHDLDLGGATTDKPYEYKSVIDGRGFTVSNFTTSALFFYSAAGSVIENIKLVCTLDNNAGNEGVLGHHTFGLVRNCYFDVTFGAGIAALTPALADHIPGGSLNNIIVVTHNPHGKTGTYADFYQTLGTADNMFSCRMDGNIGSPKKGTAITEEQLKQASTFGDASWAEHWVISDGEIPQLKKAGFPD